MCGICGKIEFDRDGFVEPSLIAGMMAVLRHRGPDGQGRYVKGQVGLGHTRLSIIDLAAGEQPIFNEDGQITVVFNGEIYNFKELRHHLVARGHRFKTSTDTEVIVHAYEEYGDACVQHFRGMFAFALWDARRQRLLLARDRVGIKPLYYAATGTGLVYASEIKALLLDPDVPSEVNIHGIDTFLSLQYMPGRETLFRGVFKVEPGHTLTVEDGLVKTSRYWDLEFPAEPQSRDLASSTEDLKALLRQTVADHMISDVPVGVLLSGGVDSTGILSIASNISSEPLHTFTIGFDSPDVTDERILAKEVSARFGAHHFETTISAQQFRDCLPKYAWHMEEPVCEPPAVALFYVSQLARSQVKVLLSGEGGDEAFAGYSNYRNLLWLERIKKFSPAFGAAAARTLLRFGPFLNFQNAPKYAHALTHPLSSYYFSRTTGPQSPFNAGKDSLYASDFYQSIGDHGPSLADLFRKVSGRDPLSQMLYVDTHTWLPDDLLLKADKMTMATSVELRVPLLDHRVLEFAAGLPAKFKMNGLEGKFILKQALQDLVPANVLNKKKTGFPVPYGSWLRGELNGYTRDVLLDARSLSRGYFRREAVENLLNHDRRVDLSSELFSLLTLELWHREFIDSKQPLQKPVYQREISLEVHN